MAREHDIADLRALGLIAAEGSLSAASRRHAIAKGTLSRALGRLERAAGAPLFDRVGRGLALTPAGEALMPAAEAAVAAMEEAEEALRGIGGAPRGPLRIAASALTGRLLLAPVVARLAATHPAVETRIETTSRGPDPVAEGFDLVLRVGRPEGAWLVARRLARSALALYTGPAQAARTDLDDPAAVEGLGRVVVDVDGVPALWDLSDAAGRRRRLAQPPLVTLGDPVVALGVLEAGAGVACLPRLHGDREVAAGRLRRALPGFEGPEVALFAALPPRRSAVPAVAAVLALLEAEVARLEPPG